MNFPLIIDENGALFFCKTKEDAENYLELQDIIENEYVAYDSDGRLLLLKIEEANKPVLFGLIEKKIPKVVIECAETTPMHRSELYNKLLTFYKKITRGAEINSEVSLKELLSMVIEKSGYCD